MKIFTQAGAGKTIIQNFCAEHFSKVWRSCGEYCFQHTRRVEMTNSKFKGPGLSLIGKNLFRILRLIVRIKGDLLGKSLRQI